MKIILLLAMLTLGLNIKNEKWDIFERCFYETCVEQLNNCLKNRVCNDLYNKCNEGKVPTNSGEMDKTVECMAENFPYAHCNPAWPTYPDHGVPGTHPVYLFTGCFHPCAIRSRPLKYLKCAR